MTGELLRATPFQARQAAANRLNAWENRGSVTLAAHFGDPAREALAARFGAVMSDVSWHARAAISGARAGEFVSRLFTRNVVQLAPGAALKALWLNDAGAVRGLGTVVRYGRDAFLLISQMADFAWLTSAAKLFDVSVRDVSAEPGVLAIAGPFAAQVLEAAGLDARLAPLGLRNSFWRGLDVTLSRLGDGYELWCQPDDALIVWDRLVAAGKPFALTPAGLAAMDILALESGVVQPGRDFAPARDGFSGEPSPQSLGLMELVDREHIFNGRAGGADKMLTGILLDSETPAPQTVLTEGGRTVGRTLGSHYSPALRQAIALGVLDVETAPGTALLAGTTPCRTAALPFLPNPAPILPGDGKSAP